MQNLMLTALFIITILNQLIGLVNYLTIIT